MAVASVGSDFITTVKQAHEFGLGTGSPTLIGFLTYIADLEAVRAIPQAESVLR